MQNLNIWKLSISIKLKLYNTAFYPSCTALSAGQSPREMYSRLMLSIKGVWCLLFTVVFSLCIFPVLFVCHSISQVTGHEYRLWNDLDCVGWGIKLNSNSNPHRVGPKHKFFHMHNIYNPTVQPSSTIFVILIENKQASPHPIYGEGEGVVFGVFVWDMLVCCCKPMSNTVIIISCQLWQSRPGIVKLSRAVFMDVGTVREVFMCNGNM